MDLSASHLLKSDTGEVDFSIEGTEAFEFFPDLGMIGAEDISSNSNEADEFFRHVYPSLFEETTEQNDEPPAEDTLSKMEWSSGVEVELLGSLLNMKLMQDLANSMPNNQNQGDGIGEIAKSTPDHDYCRNSILNLALANASECEKPPKPGSVEHRDNSTLKSLLLDANLSQDIKKEMEAVKKKSRQNMLTKSKRPMTEQSNALLQSTVNRAAWGNFETISNYYKYRFMLASQLKNETAIDLGTAFDTVGLQRFISVTESSEEVLKNPTVQNHETLNKMSLIAQGLTNLSESGKSSNDRSTVEAEIQEEGSIQLEYSCNVDAETSEIYFNSMEDFMRSKPEISETSQTCTPVLETWWKVQKSQKKTVSKKKTTEKI